MPSGLIPRQSPSEFVTIASFPNSARGTGGGEGYQEQDTNPIATLLETKIRTPLNGNFFGEKITADSNGLLRARTIYFGPPIGHRWKHLWSQAVQLIEFRVPLSFPLAHSSPRALAPAP